MNKKLIYVLIAAFLFRIIFLLFHNVVETDTPEYITLAKNLFSGYVDIEGKVSYFFTPLYPLLIKLFGYLFNFELGARLISVLFGVLLIIPVYFLTKKFYGEEEAFFASILISVYPILVYVSNLAYTESLYLFLILYIGYFGWNALEKKRIKDYLIVGLLIGLAYLTRHEGMIYLGVMFLGIFSFWLYEKNSIKKIILNLSVMVLVFLIVASPYLIFLHNQTGEWTFTAKTGMTIEAKQYPTQSQEYEKANFELNEGKTGISVLEKLYDKEQRKGVLSYFLEDPKGFIKKYLSNALAANLAIVDLFPTIFLLLAGFGLFAKHTENKFKKELWLILLILPQLLLFPLFLIEVRYFVILVPILIIWMANGITMFKKYNKLILAIVVLICIIGNFILVNSSAYGADSQPLELKKAGLWMNEQNDVEKVMARKEISAYYADANYVRLPYSDYEDMINFACYTETTHIEIAERYKSLRPQFEFLYKETPKELELVYDEEGVRIFKLKKESCKTQ